MITTEITKDIKINSDYCWIYAGDHKKYPTLIYNTIYGISIRSTKPCNNHHCVNPFHFRPDYDFYNAISGIYTTTLEWHKQNLELFEHTPTTLVQELSYHNYMVWHSEDYCRTNQEISKYKRSIDIHNQLRNNSIEAIDELLITHQKGTGPYNSETIGSILDKISISVLKLFHYIDNNKESPRIEVIIRQLYFLVHQASTLYQEMTNGTRQIMVFRQLKTYNDISTNPKMDTNYWQQHQQKFQVTMPRIL